MKRLHIIAGAGLFAALTAAGAAFAATDAPAAPAAGTCQVTVDRSQAAGSFRVDKQKLESGECVCYIYTGPASQDAAVEAQIADVQGRRDCGAPPESSGVASSAGAGGGSNVPLYVAGAAGAGGLAAALATSGHNDSTGG